MQTPTPPPPTGRFRLLGILADKAEARALAAQYAPATVVTIKGWHVVEALG